MEERERTQDSNEDGTGMGTGTGTETGTGRERGWRGEDARKTGTGTGLESKTGKRIEREREGGRELWYPSHEEESKVENQALPLHTRHHLCRQEVANAGNQQLRALDPVPARQCGNEGRTGENRAPATGGSIRTYLPNVGRLLR